MNSRAHPTYKTKYRVTSWAPCDRALVGRGDVTLWVSPEAIATWEACGSRQRGAVRLEGFPSLILSHNDTASTCDVQRRRPMKRIICVVAGLMAFAVSSAAQAPTAGQKVGFAANLQNTYGTLK